MKNRVLRLSLAITLVLGALFVQSCKKIEEAAAINLTNRLPNKSFDLDSANTAISAKGETMLFESSYVFNLDSVLKANGVKNADISNGEFKSIELFIDNPAPLEEFGFMSEVSVVVSMTKDFAESELVAKAVGIEKGDVKVVLSVKGASLDRYLKNKRFYFRLNAKVDRAVPVAFLPIIIKSKIAFTINPI